jgi:hypothetical protein
MNIENIDLFLIGKTTLIDSLKCSFLNSFFRRNRLASTRRQNSKNRDVVFEDS